MPSTMANGTLFPAFDRLYDGRLSELLAEWHAAGMSQAEVSNKIRDEHGLYVSQATISRWYRNLEVAS
jgi:arginine repressor